jgi:excisionase family DNA binding protein
MRLIDEHYVSVAKAAELLSVSRSTLWRWISQGDLPSYRFGHRRVLIKQQDLDLLITPAVGKEGGKMLDVERQRLSRPLTQPEQERALAALDAAENFSAELRQRQGGQLFSDSTEIIREMREERTRQLG